MATIKIQYEVHSCPTCGIELFRLPVGSLEIGSPIVQCPGCKKYYRNDMKQEWYAYEKKNLVYFKIPLMFLLFFVVGLFIGGDERVVMAVMAGAIGLFIGICVSISDIIKIIRSKKRMRDSEYLLLLLMMRIIDKSEFDTFLKNAKKKEEQA